MRSSLSFRGILVLLTVLCLILSSCSPAATQAVQTPTNPRPTDPPQSVQLNLGSWRVEDSEQMVRILAQFTEKYPHITIKYDPTSAPEYNEALRAQLEGGTAPDVFYLRSYAVSRELYQAGYLTKLDDLPGLKQSFSADTLAPWTGADGAIYGVPFIATSHAVYYNLDIFNQFNLAPPQTWEEFLTLAQALKDQGVTPLANASGDTWTIAELVFMNLAPGFIGGKDGRMAYLNGERCFNDASMTAVFQAMADLSPFLPENQQVLTYTDSQQLFLQGKAAMFFDGSWDIASFNAAKPSFQWSVFAPPPPAGQPPFITFHLDAGMGLNADSKHPEEARLFLSWMTSPEFGALLGNELPGFFPMHNQPIVLQEEHASKFLALNQDRGQDVRFAWEKLMEGSPDAYSLIMEQGVAILNGKQSASAAADALQGGLAQWYEPAQRCK